MHLPPMFSHHVNDSILLSSFFPDPPYSWLLALTLYGVVWRMSRRRRRAAAEAEKQRWQKEIRALIDALVQLKQHQLEMLKHVADEPEKQLAAERRKSPFLAPGACASHARQEILAAVAKTEALIRIHTVEMEKAADDDSAKKHHDTERERAEDLQKLKQASVLWLDQSESENPDAISIRHVMAKLLGISQDQLPPEKRKPFTKAIFDAVREVAAETGVDVSTLSVVARNMAEPIEVIEPKLLREELRHQARLYKKLRKKAETFPDTDADPDKMPLRQLVLDLLITRPLYHAENVIRCIDYLKMSRFRRRMNAFFNSFRISFSRTEDAGAMMLEFEVEREIQKMMIKEKITSNAALIS